MATVTFVDETTSGLRADTRGLAVEAFGRNGFLVLVGDRQVEELDAELNLRTDAEVCFLKPVPLVGG